MLAITVGAGQYLVNPPTYTTERFCCIHEFYRCLLEEALNKPKFHILQFGSGRNTKQIIDFFKERDVPFTLMTFENNPYFYSVWKKIFQDENVELYQISSVKEINKQLSGIEHKFDLIFIDRNMGNILETGEELLKLSQTLIKPNSCIVFHDAGRYNPEIFQNLTIHKEIHAEGTKFFLLKRDESK